MLPQRISASCDIAGRRRHRCTSGCLRAGIPVVVYARPHVHYHDCRDDCDLELAPPRGWQKIDADRARRRISAFRPGIDTLAMVGGHGIDVLDIDHKVGASVGMVPAELTVWGLSITPSGGWLPVPSTGYGKGDLFIAGRHVGDYVGGTLAGGGRLLCFLPGSSRPRYPRGGYLEAVRWDIDRLLDDTVPDLLVGILDAAGLSRSATPGKQAVSRAEVVRFLENHQTVGVRVRRRRTVRHRRPGRRHRAGQRPARSPRLGGAVDAAGRGGDPGWMPGVGRPRQCWPPT